MNVDLSLVYMVPHVRMLLGFTSVTKCPYSLETTMKSTLMNGSASHVSMEVYVWMEETITTMTVKKVDS